MLEGLGYVMGLSIRFQFQLPLCMAASFWAKIANGSGADMGAVNEAPVRRPGGCSHRLSVSDLAGLCPTDRICLGMNKVVSTEALVLFTADDLESHICGPPCIDMPSFRRLCRFDFRSAIYQDM